MPSLAPEAPIERLFFAAQWPTAVAPTMACFYTGDRHPEYASPMLRTPAPKVGTPADQSLVKVLREAIKINESLHDGAIMFGRLSVNDQYRLTGWSFRLSPPDASVVTIPNRGSAFNTCLHMSMVASVDFLLVTSHQERWRFIAGRAERL